VSPLAVVIPAKDEEATLGVLLERVANVGVPGYELAPIVVDDGSVDRTAEIAREYGARVVAHPRNRGLGAAVRTGLEAAVGEGAEVVAYLDADLEYQPEDIPVMVEPILAGRADYVLGIRSTAGRRMRLYRRLGNTFFTLLLRLLAGPPISDGQTGMRAFSRQAAASADIVHDYNYAQVLTLNLLGKGFRMEEVPISYRVREHGESFVGWSYPLKVLPAILREIRTR
jgi:glycosyltransferase involved in cell wall biosynthesis